MRFIYNPNIYVSFYGVKRSLLASPLIIKQIVINVQKYLELLQVNISFFIELESLSNYPIIIIYIGFRMICGVEIIQGIQKVIANSGRLLFHHGRYQECLSQPFFKYSLVQFGTKGADLGAFIGLCLPRICSDETIQTGINQILQSINVQMVVFSIDSNSDAYEFQLSWVSFITILILLGVTLATLIATSSNRPEDKLAAFNAKKHLALFKTRKSDLNILNGVRAVSMIWVIFGHMFSFVLGTTINTPTIQDQIKTPFYLLVEAGVISVDIFFFLAGFFLTYVFLRQSSNSLLKYPVAIIHRAMRIWPAYIVAMLFFYSLFMRTGSGPMWTRGQPQTEICRNMWTDILFISNLVENGANMCIGWGWYLQVDFQIFIISLFLLGMINKNKFSGYLITFALIIGSILFDILFIQGLGQKILTDIADFSTWGDYMSNLYIKPWGRLSPYLLGLLCAIPYSDYLKHKKNPSEKPPILYSLQQYLQHHRIRRIIIEWLGIGLMAFVVFLPRTLQIGNKWPQIVHSLYLSLARHVFIAGLLLMVIPSILGVTSFFRTLLDNSLLNFLAKISFCTYLVHLMVIDQFILSRTYDIYFWSRDNFTMFLGILIISLFFGFLLTIFVEFPFAQIQKSFIAYLKPKKAQLKLPQIQDEKLINKTLIETDS